MGITTRMLFTFPQCYPQFRACEKTPARCGYVTRAGADDWGELQDFYFQRVSSPIATAKKLKPTRTFQL